MKEFGATSADTERNNEVELMLVAINKEKTDTVNEFVTGSKNDQTVIESGHNSNDYTLLTVKYKTNMRNNSTKVKTPGNEEFF